MSKSDDPEKRLWYGITPLAYVGFGCLILPFAIALATSGILNLINWLFK
ncbi:MAG: hypothetical protein ABI162_08185 [Luteolibacter sp.]